jgi:hypothetical protein
MPIRNLPYYLPQAPNEINVPFIASTTVVFSPLVQDHAIHLPFIAATTNVFSMQVSSGTPRRLTQLPVEVVVQGTSSARLTQLPVEVIRRELHETVSIVIWE